MASLTAGTLLRRGLSSLRSLRAVATAGVVLAALIAGLPPGLVRSDGSAGVNVTVIPIAAGTLTVEIALSDPLLRLEPGDRFRVTAVVTNGSGEQLRRGRATLHFDHTGIAVVDDEGAPDIVGQQTRNFGAIGAERQKEVRWNLVADEPGRYVFVVAVSAVRSSDGEPVTASASITIDIGTEPSPTVAGASDGTPEANAPRREGGAPRAPATPEGAGAR